MRRSLMRRSLMRSLGVRQVSVFRLIVYVHRSRSFCHSTMISAIAPPLLWSKG